MVSSTVDTQLIKKPHRSEKFSKKQLKELQVCYDDPAYFLNTYCLIQHPILGRIKFNLYDYQNILIKDKISNEIILDYNKFQK